MAQQADLCRRVAEACRVLGALELTKATTGHVSARIPGSDRLLIRARGGGELGVRYTTEEQVLEVDLNGTAVSANDRQLASPIEVFIHTQIYLARPDVHAVVHVHPPTAVLFTICNVPLLPIYGAYDPGSAIFAVEGVPRYEKSVLIETPSLGNELAGTLGSASACLMKGHGITTVGQSVEEAALAAIHLNELAEMNFRARLLGDPRAITAEEQEAIRKLERQSKATARIGQPGPRQAALWRYYLALTGA